ncbi:hypothetical protein EVA_18351 [gut metagenome]|uniref:Uncharacterized protein n=1 Tax=gut metagenome TaxID=749906 RepID=J9FVG5_9ZZZZ
MFFVHRFLFLQQFVASVAWSVFLVARYLCWLLYCANG